MRMKFINASVSRVALLASSLRPAIVILLALCPSLLAGQAGSYVNFEGKQTNPIRLSPDGNFLFAVNTPDARLSVFNVTQPSNPRLIAEIPVGVEPVSVNALNDDEVWVVNEVSDSVSVVSVSAGEVVDTLPAKDEPADVVFAGGLAFVSASRNNQVYVFDTAGHELIKQISLTGQNPRALAVNAAGTKVYVAFALAGNQTLILNASNAPPQITNSPPMNPSLPLPPQVGLIVSATNSFFTALTNNYQLPANGVAEIDVATLAVTRYFPQVGSVNLGLAIWPGSGDLVVASTQARNLVHFQPVLCGHVVDNDVSMVDINSGAVKPYDLNPGVDYTLLPNLPALTNALAIPTALVFDPSGSPLYVAAFGTDRVGVIDTNFNITRIEIGSANGSQVDPRHKRGPRGLALNAGAHRLYVLNRISNTISIVDTVSNTVLHEIPVGSYDPTPRVIREGRGFLYDAKLSGNGTMACASCHVDAEMDLLAWDLGDPTAQMDTNTVLLPLVGGGFATNSSLVHPMKGPMVTQTLRGLNGLSPLHWRGDRTNFLAFNPAFSALLGGNTLSITDMTAYANFVNTITFEPNPNQNLDRTYPTNFAGGDAVAGMNAFLYTNYDSAKNLVCADCHLPPPGPGSNRQIISQLELIESQDFKVPQLRNIYQKLNVTDATGTNLLEGFGLTHDGAVTSLQDFLTRSQFVSFQNDPVVKNNLAAFVECFDTGTAPAVGYSVTVNQYNITDPSVSNAWSLLESQAALTNVDLIAHISINGQPRGLLYNPQLQTYQLDTTNIPPLSRAEITSLLPYVEYFTVMGVPPGSGTRMGIDRNEDGVLDGDEPAPGLGITPAPNGVALHWPYGATGYNLESATPLSSWWSPVTNPVTINQGENWVTNGVEVPQEFFRLSSP
jgi:YVTN family beta-propeller protein